MKSISESLVITALTKLGVKESGGNNKGKELQPFFAADNYKPNATDDGYAWCASFVCWVFQVVLAGRSVTFKRPTTPSAFGFIDWSLAQDSSTNTKRNPMDDIKRGDLVIFKFSHIGIALADAKDGKIQTIDGNTNAAGSREGNAVAKKTRAVSQVKARIRIKG
jgi:cell wall-associated NlpC family hydrolase